MICFVYFLNRPIAHLLVIGADGMRAEAEGRKGDLDLGSISDRVVKNSKVSVLVTKNI